ncbi:MAG TPA: hypothetical protein VIU35_17690, partial [Chitinophagaceae bacterium]
PFICTAIISFFIVSGLNTPASCEKETIAISRQKIAAMNLLMWVYIVGENSKSIFVNNNEFINGYIQFSKELYG